MSERWYAKSAYFRSEHSSFRDSAVFNEKLREKLRTLQILSFIPVLNWTEKFLAVLDFCQYFALLWIMAQPWPWPYLWSTYTQPAVWFNGDYFSTTSNGALAGRSSTIKSQWGSMDNYTFYALLFAVVQFAIFFMIIALNRNMIKNGYGQVTPELKNHTIAVLSFISYVIYLPCSLATFRLYFCETLEGKNVLGADPSVGCLDLEHIIYLTVCSFCTLPVFFGLPFLMYKSVKRNIVYAYDVDHEKRLQIWEILHMLSLDESWLKRQFWITSSFTLFGAYYRVHMVLLKATLLIVFIFARSDFVLQSLLAMLATVVFCLYYGIGAVVSFHWLPYRNATSNGIMLITFGMMITDSVFGMVNAFGVENAVTVGSAEFLFLAAFNALGVCLVVLCVILSLLSALRIHDWPAVRTLDRIRHDEALLPKAAHWVEVMREVMIIRADFLMSPIEVADIYALEDCIRKLRSCWLSARGCGSLFEVPLSEFLEELLFIHSTRYPNALRKHPYWDNAYCNNETRALLQKRYFDHSMMAPVKRRLMLKFLAIRFLKGDRGAFSMDVAMRQARLDKIQKEKRAAETKAAKSKKKRRNSTTHETSFGFGKFAKNAKALLSVVGADGIIADAPSEENLDGYEAAQKEIERLTRLEQGELAAQRQASDGALLGEEGEGEGLLADGDDDEEGEGSEEGGFNEFDIEAAALMISRLIERTEAALNKHHHAKKALVAQEAAALESAIESAASDSSGGNLAGMLNNTAGGLAKISTMELIKETVDKEEQKELEEMYFLWDEAIQLYEIEEFPGDYEELNQQAENWYTYRSLITQRLEVVVNTLNEHNYNDLVDQDDIIEEGEESDEEDEDENSSKGSKKNKRNNPQLQNLQSLSSTRQGLLTKPGESSDNVDSIA